MKKKSDNLTDVVIGEAVAAILKSGNAVSMTTLIMQLRIARQSEKKPERSKALSDAISFFHHQQSASGITSPVSGLNLFMDGSKTD